ncbi:MAG TPA: hypothetical protein VH325_07565 [Bryobacteraceae bacterium]|jgi:hypothetical protein|nr:hypothetical protein [Bryobacteraceae bacterium]
MNVTGIEAFPLPPLILHPFSTPEDNSVLVESSRASLALQGFLPQDDTPVEELDRRLLRGRYAELRMLYYIGKDLLRWMDQCCETAEMSEVLAGRATRPETFGVFIVEETPAHVRTKLESWGVLDFSALFRRAIGLHSVLSDLPPQATFGADFLRRYHRYVDAWYDQRLRDTLFDRANAGEFTFDLYASGEYTLMLEQSWAAESKHSE